LGAVALDLVPAEDGHERLRRAGYQVDTCLVFLGNGLDDRDVDILSRVCQTEGIRVLAPDTSDLSQRCILADNHGFTHQIGDAQYRPISVRLCRAISLAHRPEYRTGRINNG
jgi:hypothetical protein